MNYSDQIIRSATLENMADKKGVINVAPMLTMYRNLSAKTVITGFVYVSENGRAMHPGQAGIVTGEQQEAWEQFASQLKRDKPDLTLVMQLAHTGRQTTRPGAVGASSVKCTYFKNKPTPLAESGIRQIIDDFAQAAKRAQAAGFDGVQIHAAHGYLIHQFLSSHTNKRTDRYQNGVLFLKEVLQHCREACGQEFKIWIKISHGDDRGLDVSKIIPILQEVESLIDAIEVSYGTMEYALNIIRGRIPIDEVLNINPLFNRYAPWVRKLWKKFCYPSYKKRFLPFSLNYNLKAALQIKKAVSKPVFVTGGIRRMCDIEKILSQGIDAVSLSRPFLREPDLVHRLHPKWVSSCTNCNLCAIHCDSISPTHCYQLETNNTSL